MGRPMALRGLTPLKGMKKKPATQAKPFRSQALSKTKVVSPVDGAFDEIVHLIQTARQRSYQSVNT